MQQELQRSFPFCSYVLTYWKYQMARSVAANEKTASLPCKSGDGHVKLIDMCTSSGLWNFVRSLTLKISMGAVDYRGFCEICLNAYLRLDIAQKYSSWEVTSQIS